MNAMELDLPYLMRDQDRHGNWRIFARRNGRKIRIREKPGTPEFARAYSDALEALDAPVPEGRKIAPAGTLGWLAALYFASGEFKGLDPRSQASRRLIIEECLREPRKPGSSDLMARCPLAAFSAKHMKVLRDRKISKPGAANNRRKHLSAMFGWAVEAGHVKSNPVRDARRIRYRSKGFHTWSVEEVRQYEDHHPIGTKARLALALLLFTGVRRGDVVTLGKQHIRDGWLRFVPGKTRHLRDVLSEKPVLPALADVIARSPVGDLTFLVTEYGRAFTAAGFGDRIRKWCDAAGLPQCTAHGLRKAGATIAADLGASDRQLMALYDWTTASMATPYTRATDKKRLTEEAAKLIVNGQCPTALPHQKTG
jgi:integrase